MTTSIRSESAINRFLAEQMRSNTLSAGHHENLNRLPGKPKPWGWKKFIAAQVIVIVVALVLISILRLYA